MGRMSNTATPHYYGKFRAAVLRGDIPVNREIAMEMNRIDALIADRTVYYDPDPLEGFILYCENELTLTDGSDLRLLETFKLWAEQIFCWYYFDEVPEWEDSPDGHGGRFVMVTKKQRLIRKQYLIVARGAAKSLYESFLQSFFLVMFSSTTHQVTTAPTIKHSE